MVLMKNRKEKSLFEFNNLNYPLDKFTNLIEKGNRPTVGILSINKLKYYNYIFGYKFGDKIIDFALTKVKQQINTYGEVYRFGGSKLLIVLCGINSKHKLIKIIQNIETVFSKNIEIDKKMVRILISIGIVPYSDGCFDENKVLKCAEMALDLAKNSDSKRYIFFEHDMYEDIVNNEKFQIDILNSMINREFILYYQPQFNIKTKKLYGMEALIRWNHPKKGILSPNYFIDIIERNGMINEVGKFVFEEACTQLSIWNKSGYKNLTMSINVSHKQLEDISFLSFVKQVIFKTKLDPQNIIIEITERNLLNPTEKIVEILIELVDLGIKIFIDDFGTKYASLNYLYKFPIHGIKIDKSFIDRIQDSEKELIITKHIISLAKEISLDVVAEGVEKEEQLKQLVHIDCCKIQGYIFGKPVNASDFVKYFEKYGV